MTRRTWRGIALLPAGLFPQVSPNPRGEKACSNSGLGEKSGGGGSGTYIRRRCYGGHRIPEGGEGGGAQQRGELKGVLFGPRVPGRKPDPQWAWQGWPRDRDAWPLPSSFSPTNAEATEATRRVT